MGDRYLNFLPETVHLVPAAEDVCRKLSASTPLGIVTNGIVHVQKQRLSKSGLEPYFKFMVISDEVGVAKPDRRIFDFALNRAGQPVPENVLMVGDRLPADILGAQRAGIKTCWFNPSRFPNETEIAPDFEIHKLEDVLRIQNG
jgi:2-haloacid dehalogenase